MNAAELRMEMGTELDRILAYWMEHAPDAVNGGYLGELDNKNLPREGASKGAILHARILWTFSAAYRARRLDAYLAEARRAFAYLRDAFVDREHGGVFWELDAKGNVLNPRKQIYAIAFAMYGMSEYHLACGDAEALELAKGFFEVIERYSFDGVENGYFEALTREWGPLDDVRLSAKDENALKTMNTHLHVLEAYTNLYRVWKDATLARQLKNLIEVFLERIIQPDAHFGLFFDAHWNLSSRNVSPGHDIEGSWLLHEAAEVLGDEALLSRVCKVALRMAEVTAAEGVAPNGGVREELHVATGHRDPSFHWWPQAEGIVGFYNAWQLSGKMDYLALALRIWAFTRSCFLDRKHGEWFWQVDASGKPMDAQPKLGFWKCPYHNGRACLEILHRVPSDAR
jgi:mannobiose 2-epimerase